MKIIRRDINMKNRWVWRAAMFCLWFGCLWQQQVYADTALQLVSEMALLKKEADIIIKDTKTSLQEGVYSSDLDAPPETTSTDPDGWTDAGDDYPGLVLLGVRSAPVLGYFSGILGKDAAEWQAAQNADEACLPYYETIQKNENKISDLNKQLSPLAAKKQTLQSRLSQLETKYEAAAPESKMSLKIEIDRVSGQIDTVNRQIKPLEQKIRENGQAIEQARRQLKPLEKNFQKAYDELIKEQSRAWDKLLSDNKKNQQPE